jgi:D-alanyl-D-alanine carboxypeptidase
MKSKKLLTRVFCFLVLCGCSSPVISSPTMELPTEIENTVDAFETESQITPSLEPGISPEIELSIERQVKDTLESTPLAGLTLGIRYGHQMPFIASYGYANKETLIPAGVDTVYMLGSVTKQFTAAVIMNLMEQGRLGLDLTGIPQRWEVVTIRQLLTHTGGIPNYATDSMGFDITQFYTPEELMIKFTKWNLLDFEPGTRWEYSNRGYFLLGMIVKQITGQTYSDYLRQHILKPLGLEHTESCVNVTQNLAQGYRIMAFGTEPKLAPPVNASFAYGAGDLCSTAGDLLEWQEALATGLVVSDESYQMMITPIELPDGTQTGYGFGLEISEKNGRLVISHAGGIPSGFIVLLTYYPDEDYGIVLLTNTMTAAYNPLVSLETSITTSIQSNP